MGAVILCDLKIFARALFLDQVVLPTARLGAGAAVCVPAGQVV